MRGGRLLIGPLLRRVVGTRATVWVETSAPAVVTVRAAGGRTTAGSKVPPVLNAANERMRLGPRDELGGSRHVEAGALAFEFLKAFHYSFEVASRR